MKEPKISVFLEKIGIIHLKIVKRERFRSRRSGCQINKTSKLAYRYKVTVSVLFFLETKPKFPFGYVGSSYEALVKNLRIPLWYAKVIYVDMLSRRLHFEQDSDIESNLRKRISKIHKFFPHIVRKCKICHTPFLVTSIRTYTCSTECRLKNWKLKAQSERRKKAMNEPKTVIIVNEKKLKKKEEKFHMTVEDLTELVLREIV